jgi:hypothetical protein
MAKKLSYTQVKAHAKQDRKRREADLLQGKYNALSTAAKIALVTARGGSKRELARLLNPKAKPAVAPTPVAPVKAEVFVSDKKRKSGKKSVNEANKTKRPAKS